MINKMRYFPINKHDNKIKREHRKMTVCIAAIFENSSVHGAADRMITVADGLFEYQPTTKKIWKITKSISALVGGDIQTQKAVYDLVAQELGRDDKTGGKDSPAVKTVAELYHRIYLEEKKNAASKAILFPLDLTIKSFIKNQKEMDENIAIQIHEQIQNYAFPKIETLIIGTDAVGPHIFSITDDLVIDHDHVGFAAIGNGQAIAESHLIQNNYSPDMDLVRSLLYLHRAKKSSESASGVGDKTDIIAHGPTYEGFFINDPMLSILDKAYSVYLSLVRKTDEENFGTLTVMLREFIEAMDKKRREKS